MFKRLTEKGREYKDAALTAGLKAVTAVVTTTGASDDSAPVVADVRPPTPTQPTVHSWPAP